jgi:hypothetical protein
MFTLISFLLVFLIFSIYLFIRNCRVYKERMRMLDRCDPRSADYQKRHKEFDQFTYGEIFWKIWKPVKSFYKEYK